MKIKVYKVSTVSLWIMFLILLIPDTSSAGVIPCNGPTDAVRVTVKQESDSPPKYSYVIKNLRETPIAIKAMALGDSDHEEMYSIEDSLPKKLTSPIAWESGVAYTDESVFMRIFWKTKDLTVIAPGNSLGGFKVELSQPKVKKGEAYLLYGKPIKVVDMKNAPFNIFLGDGVCVWGRVVDNSNEIK